MNACPGKFYDGETARSCEAVLVWDPDEPTLTLQLTDSHQEVHVDRNTVRIDTTLGAASPRMVQFEGGGRFYTNDGCALDGLYRSGERKKFNPQDWASRLERHRYAILFSMALLLVFLVVGYRYGIPAIADSLAFKLPASTLESMSENTLNTLDRYLGFRPTKLEEAEQTRLRALFDQLVLEMGSKEYQYALEFRSFGVNAFALPSGLIIVGDELIEVMPNDDVVLAVLSHELAHVEYRHATRQLLREAGVAFLIGSAFGDLGSSAGIFATLPKVMMTSGYSRKFESDADLFAADYMLGRYGNSEAMIQALETLAEVTKGTESESLGWISSHPLTQKRIQLVREHVLK